MDGRIVTHMDVLPPKGGLDIPAVSDLTYETLRDEIVRAMPPGKPLRLRDLAARYMVSVTPVRQAVERLRSEGFVSGSPRRGVVVAPMDRDDIHDIQTIRASLEGTAARMGVQLIAQTSLAQLRYDWENAREEWSYGEYIPFEDYFRLTTRMQDACYLATRMPKLIRLIRDYRRLAERYLRLSLADSNNLERDAQESDIFVQACEQRDPDLAEETIQRLLRWTTERVAVALEDR